MNEQIKRDILHIINHIDLEKFYGKNILITGASGFIPRYLVYLFMLLNDLKNSKCKLFLLVHKRESVDRYFKEFEHSEWLQISVGNIEEHGELGRDMNYVFHAAGVSNSRRFSSTPVEVATANTIGVYGLLNTMKNSKNVEGFIFFSSGAVYGDSSTATHHVKENEYFPLDPLNEKNCYAESKRMGENFCYSFYKQYGIPVKILRIGHTYGPGIDLNDGHVYSDFVKFILERRDIAVLGEPDSVRPFTYILDTITGILIAAMHGVNGEAYNLCNSHGLCSIGELAELLAYNIYADRKIKVLYSKNRSTKKNVRKIDADTGKLEQLGWQASIDVEEGFRRTIKSFESMGESEWLKDEVMTNK